MFQAAVDKAEIPGVVAAVTNKDQILYLKAFGKQDLDGALQAWQRVVELSPNTLEGQAATRAIESLKSAHPEPETQKPGS